MRDARDLRQVRDLELRIRRRLRPKEFCAWTDSFFHGGQICHVDKRDFQTPGDEEIAQKSWSRRDTLPLAR